MSNRKIPELELLPCEILDDDTEMFISIGDLGHSWLLQFRVTQETHVIPKSACFPSVKLTLESLDRLQSTLRTDGTISAFLVYLCIRGTRELPETLNVASIREDYWLAPMDD